MTLYPRGKLIVPEFSGRLGGLDQLYNVKIFKIFTVQNRHLGRVKSFKNQFFTNSQLVDHLIFQEYSHRTRLAGTIQLGRE